MGSFSPRFPERLCECFGFVETRREYLSAFRRKLFVKASDFLKYSLLWHEPRGKSEPGDIILCE
jgi:hypothetical protein